MSPKKAHAPVAKDDTGPSWPADAVARRAVASLVPHARNARTHSPEQIAQIARSMTEFGFTNPVLLDEDGGIIAGHGRVLAARKLGIVDIPCMVARGWSDAQKRAYLIADNAIALNAGWDESLLKIEFAELKAIDFDLTLTGFTLDAIGAFFPELHKPPDEFGAYGEDLETEHECPRCRFKWSGGSATR